MLWKPNKKWRCFIKSSDKNKKINMTKIKSEKKNNRIILCLSQLGDVLPLMPVFAGLFAWNSLALGVLTVYDVIRNSRKKGSGLYLNVPVEKGVYLNGKGFIKNKKIKDKN